MSKFYSNLEDKELYKEIKEIRAVITFDNKFWNHNPPDSTLSVNIYIYN